MQRRRWPLLKVKVGSSFCSAIGFRVMNGAPASTSQKYADTLLLALLVRFDPGMAFKLNRFGWVEEKGAEAADPPGMDAALGSTVGLLGSSGLFMSPSQLQQLVAGGHDAHSAGAQKELEVKQQWRQLQQDQQEGLAAQARAVADAAAALQENLEGKEAAEEEGTFAGEAAAAKAAAAAANELWQLTTQGGPPGVSSTHGTWQMLEGQQDLREAGSGAGLSDLDAVEVAIGRLGEGRLWSGGGRFTTGLDDTGEGVESIGQGRAPTGPGDAGADARPAMSSGASSPGAVRGEHLRQVHARLDYLLAQLQPAGTNLQQQQQRQQHGSEPEVHEQQLAGRAASGQQHAEGGSLGGYRTISAAGGQGVSQGGGLGDDRSEVAAPADGAGDISFRGNAAIGISSIGSWLAASSIVTATTNSRSSSRRSSRTGDQDQEDATKAAPGVGSLDATSQHMQELQQMADALQAALGEFNAAAVAAAAADTAVSDAGDMPSAAGGGGGLYRGPFSFSGELGASSDLALLDAAARGAGGRVGGTRSSSSRVGSTTGDAGAATGYNVEGAGVNAWSQLGLAGFQGGSEEAGDRAGGAPGVGGVTAWGEAGGDGLTEEFISASSASET